MGVALALGFGIVVGWVGLRQQQTDRDQAAAVAGEATYIADAATKYVSQHYAAFEQWFSSAGAPQSAEYDISCVGAANCTMPAVGYPVGTAYGTANWSSLAQARFLPAAQSDINRLGQGWRLVVRCVNDVYTASPYPTCTQISAMVVAFGGPTASDTFNSMVANDVGPRAGFLPLDATLTGGHSAPNWITQGAFWSVGGTPQATPGRIAITLDLDIANDIRFGPIQRLSGGDDTRPQTMSRTTYMGSNSVNQSPANVCMCSSTGYYEGACQVPNGIGVPDTPTSPNFCGVPP
jgi:hypothetical protein